MTSRGSISPTHRSVRKYYETLEALRKQDVDNEMSVRSAFEFLLAETAKLKGWTLVPELSEKSGGSLMRPDGTLRDSNSLPRGYWEAKDSRYATTHLHSFLLQDRILIDAPNAA